MRVFLLLSILWMGGCATTPAGRAVQTTSVGGGFVIVPSLSHFTNLATRSIVATSLTVIALVSAGGVAAAAWQGAVDWHVAVPFAAGAIAALLAGRQLAARLAGKRLQQSFAAISAAVAVLMLARAAGWIAA